MNKIIFQNEAAHRYLKMFVTKVSTIHKKYLIKSTSSIDYMKKKSDIFCYSNTNYYIEILY